MSNIYDPYDQIRREREMMGMLQAQHQQGLGGLAGQAYINRPTTTGVSEPEENKLLLLESVE